MGGDVVFGFLRPPDFPHISVYSIAMQRTSEPFSFFAVPVKVRGMGTFPVRAFALVHG